MKKDGFDHAGEDLGYVNAHNLRDHLWEIDVSLQSLCLYEQIVGELVQLSHNLSKGKSERVGEEDVTFMNNKDDSGLMRKQSLQIKVEVTNGTEALEL